MVVCVEPLRSSRRPYSHSILCECHSFLSSVQPVLFLVGLMVSQEDMLSSFMKLSICKGKQYVNNHSNKQM